MKTFLRMLPKFGLLLLALTIGVAAALALNRTSVPSVYAANHCTRYAPVVSQDYNCTVVGSLDPTGYYQTPSTGLRDNNQISMGQSRSWSLWYANSIISASGTGTYGSTGGSGGAYRAADCSMASSVVSGYCVTDWHD